MPNPLYDSMKNLPANKGLAQMLQQAQEFKKTFHGNPREEVQKLLNSGQMSQAQFNHYSQIAQQMLPFLK